MSGNIQFAVEDRAAGQPQQEEAAVLIFGASGDLVARKLMPALYSLWRNGYLSDRVPIIGVARREMTDEFFRAEMGDALSRNEGGEVAGWERFSRRLFYYRLDLMQSEDYAGLRERVEQIEHSAGLRNRRIVYLATAPELFLPAVESLAAAEMIPRLPGGEPLRVVFEKPFGNDLESAMQLSRRLNRYLAEEQIYRIDHYLGKETVQNILLFRFGNAIFEPLLNRNHVDHVQITVSESQGIEARRGAYYDSAGAIRDVLQNHVLQLLCLTAMEPPARFGSRAIQDEKLKVLQALAPGESGSASRWVVTGQYTPGEIAGRSVRGYREEDRVDPQSLRETFVAMKLGIDNWRWAGVPFYVRTGKRMPVRVTEIAIQFKLPPLNLFTTVECEGDICDLVEARPNTLIFRIQPHEAIQVSFSTKRPGMQYQIQPVTMNFDYRSAFQKGLPEAYERLLLDVLRGDATLFTRSDELEAAWRFVDPVLNHLQTTRAAPAEYTAGTWGPPVVDELLRQSGRTWRRPEPDD